MEECRRGRDKRKDRNTKQQEKAVGSLYVKFEKQRGKGRKRGGKMHMLTKRYRQM